MIKRMAAATDSEIFEVIRKNLCEILPELESVDIDPRQSMKDLGANSLDRADVVLQTMGDLQVSFPLNELAGVENIQGLIDFLRAKLEG